LSSAPLRPSRPTTTTGKSNCRQPTARGAESKPSIAQQFIDGHHAVSFSILVPETEGEKRVERVTVTCDEGKCRVRVVSISQRACGGGMTYQGRGFVPFDEMIQVNDYGPEEKSTGFRPKVTPGDDGMLIVQFSDGGQDAHLRVLLRWEKSDMPSHEQFIASGGVVGEEEIVLSRPIRFAPIAEIVGSPIICHARFQSR
jgi:hypothetical protein